MKIALHAPPMSVEGAQFARQVGVRHIVSAFPPSPLGAIELAELLQARAFFAEAGLSFDVIENLPLQHYDKAMFGLPGRDEQIANVCQSIRNVGRAGVRVLGYQWMLLGGLRTEYSPTGRGGARVSRFDLAVASRAPASAMDWRRGDNVSIHLPDRVMSSEEVWDNLTYFLERVVPVAEEAGVQLAAHPDDPPLPSFLGVARILSSLEGLQRLIDVLPSPCSGLDFCQGTVSEMTGVDVVDAIRHFGRQKKIFFAHFRNPRGAVPRFDEVFFDEGDTDMFAAMRAYHEIGFDGLLRADHTPGIIGDNVAHHRGFAFQIGYMRGLVQAVEALGSSGNRPPQRGGV